MRDLDEVRDRLRGGRAAAKGAQAAARTAGRGFGIVVVCFLALAGFAVSFAGIRVLKDLKSDTLTSAETTGIDQRKALVKDAIQDMIGPTKVGVFIEPKRNLTARHLALYDPAAVTAPGRANGGTPLAQLDLARIAEDTDRLCLQRATKVFDMGAKTAKLTTKGLNGFAFLDTREHYDALIICLMTLAPERLCDRSVRNSVAHEIAYYFRGARSAAPAIQDLKREDLFQSADQDSVFDNSENIRKLREITRGPAKQAVYALQALIKYGYVSSSDFTSFFFFVDPDIDIVLKHTPPAANACAR